MAGFEDVATLLLVLEAENRASPEIDAARRSVEEYAAAVDAASANTAAASAEMDGALDSTAAKARALRTAEDDLGSSTKQLADGSVHDLDQMMRNMGYDITDVSKRLEGMKTTNLQVAAEDAQTAREAYARLAETFNVTDADLKKALTTIRKSGVEMKGTGAEAVALAEDFGATNEALAATAQSALDLTDVDFQKLSDAADESKRLRTAQSQLATSLGISDAEARRLLTSLKKADEATAAMAKLEEAGRLTGSAVRDTAKAAEEADSAFKKFGDSAKSAVKHVNDLGKSADNTGGRMSRMRLLITLAAVAIAGLAGPIGGLIALGPAAFFVGIGLAASSMKKSIDAAVKSGTQLTAFQTAALPIVNELSADYKQLQPVLMSAAKGFASVMASLGPTFQAAAKALGPILTSLIKGFGDFIAILAKGFLPILQASKPVVDALSQGLGTLARGIVGLVQNIDMTGAAQGFRDLFNVVGQILPLIGQLISLFMPFGHVILGVVLPPLLQLVGVLMTQLKPLMGPLSAALAQLVPPFMDLIKALLPIIPPLVQLVIALLPGFVQGLTWVVTAVTRVVTAIMPTIVAIINFVTTHKQVVQIIGIVLGVLAALWLALSINPWVAIAVGIIALVTLIVQHWTQIKDFVTGAVTAIAKWIKDTFGPIAEWVKTNLIDPIVSGFQNFWKSIKTALDPLIAEFSDWWGQIMKFFQDNGDTIKRIWNEVWDALSKVLKPIWDAYIGWTKLGWELLKTIFKTGAAIIHDTIDFIGRWIGDLITFFKGVIDFLVGLFTGNWSRAWEGIKEIFRSFLDWFNGLWDFFVSIGADIIKGIVQGIENMVGWLMNTISSIGNGIVNAFKAALSIFSPSQVMADQVGAFIPAGIAKGINDNAHLITAAAQQASSKAVTGAQMGFSATASLNPLNAATAGAGGGTNMQLIFQGNQVMNNQSMQDFAQKVGNVVARYVLPQGGVYIRR